MYSIVGLEILLIQSKFHSFNGMFSSHNKKGTLPNNILLVCISGLPTTDPPTTTHYEKQGQSIHSQSIRKNIRFNAHIGIDGLSTISVLGGDCDIILLQERMLKLAERN